MRPFLTPRVNPCGVFGFRLTLCLSFCLALFLLPLAACSTKPQSTSTGVLSSPAAQSPALTGEAQPEVPEELRSLGMKVGPAKTEEGFFSFGAEVLPEKSTKDALIYGIRLYFNNVATKQTQPLNLPDTENGYLRESKDPSSPFAFMADGRLVILYPDKKIESFLPDLSDRTTLKEAETTEDISQFNFLFFSNKYLYYTSYDEGEGRTQLGKINLEDGMQEFFYTLADNEFPVDVYDGQILLTNQVYKENNSEIPTQRESETLYALDPQTGEKKSLYTLDEKKTENLEYQLFDGQICWRIAEENMLGYYNIATGETKQFPLEEELYYYTVFQNWGDRLIVGASREDMDGGGYHFWYVDTRTGETAPIPWSQPDSAFLPLIQEEFGEYYLTNAADLEGKTWAVSASGEIVQMEKTEAYTPAVTLQATDYIRQYALIKKQDYWQGKENYIPFTLMAQADGAGEAPAGAESSGKTQSTPVSSQSASGGASLVTQ